MRNILEKFKSLPKYYYKVTFGFVSLCLVFISLYLYLGNSNIDILPQTGSEILENKTINVFESSKDGIHPHWAPNNPICNLGKLQELTKLDISTYSLDIQNSLNFNTAVTNLSERQIIQKVLVIIYDTHLNSSYPYNDPAVLTSQLSNLLELASAERKYDNNYSHHTPNIRINIADTIIYNTPSPLIPNQSGSGAADYNKIINDNNLCNRLNNNEFDEVWLWADRTGGYWEAIMAGPAAQIFDTNGGPIIRQDCNKAMHIMGFNYEVAVDQALHSYGHRIENTLARFWDGKHKHNALPGDTYYSFAGHFYSTSSTNLGYVGNVHFPPNATAHYDYNNFQNQETFIRGWNPQHNIPKSTTNCNAWNCNHGNYLVMWMQNIPGKCLSSTMRKVNNEAMPNMWRAILKNEFLYETSDCKVISVTNTSAPITTNTVRPTVTNTVRPTVTNTVRPTNTIVPTNTTAPGVTNTIRPTNTIAPNTIVCGPLDQFGQRGESTPDNKLHIFDFIAFRKVYQSYCSDVFSSNTAAVQAYGPCGGKNIVGGINLNRVAIEDFINLRRNYNTDSCAINLSATSVDEELLELPQTGGADSKNYVLLFSSLFSLSGILACGIVYYIPKNK
jgi:hypothetical protein